MYELLYIVPAPYTEKDLDGISQKVKKLISDLGGTITHEENLGGKKLAYPIKNIYRGFYLLIHFKINAKKIKELDPKLKLASEILRYMITTTIKSKPRPEKKLKRKKVELDIFEQELLKKPSPSKTTADKEEKDVSDKAPKKEEKQEKPKKSKKIDLKKLGDKIDELLKI